MSQRHRVRSRLVAATALLLTGLLGWPAAGTAQLGGILQPPTGGILQPPPIDIIPTVVGNAKAVQASVLGSTTALADTGTLGGTDDAREASQVTGSIPSLLGGEVLHAVTIGWPDQVASEASIGNLGLTVAGITVAADFVMARALAIAGAAGGGSSTIDNLVVNGVPIAITGLPNQTLAIPGVQLVINEQTISSTGAAVVNALHLTVNGVADLVIASATAGIS
jgi:hypothetical protein